MRRTTTGNSVRAQKRSKQFTVTFAALSFIILSSAFSGSLLVGVNAAATGERSSGTNATFASIAYGAISLIRDDYIRKQFSDRMGSIAAYSVAPDSWGDPLDHISLQNGTGYAVDMVHAYYGKMVTSLAAEQWDNATEWFAYLTNYYVDLWNPFDTANPTDPQSGAYDIWLSANINYVIDQLDMSSVDVTKVSDLPQFCRDAATQSRQLYSSLTTAIAGNDTAGALLVAKATVQGAVNGLARILETSFGDANLNSIEKQLLHNSWLFFVAIIVAVVMVVVLEVKRRVRELPRQRAPEEEAF